MNKRKKKKKVPFIWCHYRRGWVPMGRAKKRCPVCGAVIMKGDVGHRIKMRMPIT